MSRRVAVLVRSRADGVRAAICRGQRKQVIDLLDGLSAWRNRREFLVRPGTRSSIERTITWPASGSGNSLEFQYFVDSEPNGDFLRIYIDGNEVFSASGRNKFGRQAIPIGAGAHRVKLEYVKDESVDEGLDDAWVTGLRATTATAVVSLDGTRRSVVGDVAEGWEAGADATVGSWVVAHEPAPRLYAVRSTNPTYPTLDGEIASGEYADVTQVDLPAFETDLPRGELWLRSAQDGRLHLGLQLPLPGSGTSQGQAEFYIDADHLRTLEGRACGPSQDSPGPEDRRFVVALDSQAGSATFTTQQRGTCGVGTGWEAAPSGGEWPTSASLGQPPNDSGFAHLELLLDPGASLLPGTSFGLGAAVSLGGFRSRLPNRDGEGPLETDATTWEIVTYDPVPPAEVAAPLRVDGIPKLIVVAWPTLAFSPGSSRSCSRLPASKAARLGPSGTRKAPGCRESWCRSAGGPLSTTRPACWWRRAVRTGAEGTPSHGSRFPRSRARP